MIGTFIKRPVFTTMFILLLVVFGIKSYPELGVDLNPDVDLPIVSVYVTYDGASPSEMETLVTKKLENRVSQVSGIKSLTSTVKEGFSQTVLEFEIGTDPQQKASEVREKVTAVRRFLPDDIDEPVTQTVDLNSRPIVAFAFSSESRHRNEIRRIIEDNIKDQLLMVSGVADVSVYGGNNRAMRIVLKPEKMSEYGVSYQTIREKLNTNNYNTPGGKTKGDAMEITVRVIGKYKTIEDLRAVAIGNFKGRPVYISDVADVVDSFKDDTNFASIDGVPAVNVFIRRQSMFNTVLATDNIMKKMDELQKYALPHDIKVTKIRDQSVYIRDNIADVWNTIFFGGFLALFITYMFLRNFRATLIGGLCIPTAVIATFFMMKAMNFSLNNMSLMALSLAVGMLIDDAIVVIENIFRHIEMGKSPFVAAREATEELTLAILATSFVMFAVFVPIGSMGETVGQFFKQFGLTVATAIAFSTVVAFTMTPMVSAYWIGKEEKKAWGPWQKCLDKFEECFQWVRKTYNSIMEVSVKHPKKIIAGAVCSLFINFGLMPFIGTEMQPTYDSGEFMVNFAAPIGTSIPKMVKITKPLQEYINSLPETESCNLTLGRQRNPINRGIIDVKLKPSNERKRTMMEVMDDLRIKFRDNKELKITITTNQGGSRTGDSRPVQIGLRGSNEELLQKYANELADMIRELPGAADVDLSDTDRQPEILVKIDHAKASSMGLDATEVGKVVEMSILGKKTSNSYTIGSNDYDVYLQLQKDDRTKIDDVRNLKISNSSGSFIRLGDIADIEMGSGPTRIDREDKQRQIVVFSNAIGVSGGEMLDKIVAECIPKLNMEPGYNYKIVGQGEMMKKTFNEVRKAVILAIIIVYMVLAAQFESFTQPLIIMASVPFALIGAILGLLLAGQTANMMSMIGFTMLLGLVTKNAILLVDYANQAREEGKPIKEAVLEACSLRLRPIFMTTWSTVLGMMPIALGIGEGAELRQSMGVVLVGGLTTSTFLTLVVIPLIYMEFEGWKEKHYTAKGE